MRRIGRVADEMPRLGPPVIGPKASPGRDHAIFIRETPGYRGTEPSRRAGDERDRPRRAICDILSRAARLRLLRPRRAICDILSRAARLRLLRPRCAICDILSRAARLRLLRPRHAPHSCLIRSS
jgi:hypothetical protein